MIDKTPYVQQFKEKLIEKGHEVTDEEALDYFEMLSAFYEVLLRNIDPAAEEKSLKEMEDEENNTSNTKREGKIAEYANVERSRGGFFSFSNRFL